MKIRAMLAALLLAAGLVCVPGCKKAAKKTAAENAEPTTPSEVAAAYMKALMDGDEAAALKLCTGKNAEKDVKEAVREMAEAKKKAEADPKCEEALGLAVLKNYKFAETIEGDKATTVMIAVFDVDGEKREEKINEISFTLKKVDGEWKLDCDAMDAASQK